MSNTTTLTIRLNADVKKAARRRAERLGISLGTVVENDLRRFINGHPVIIDDDCFVPSQRLRQDIEAADAEHAAGDYTTVMPDELDAYFDNLRQSDR
jgi:antitoxin component of RelBE/YafQ-DinJ toxin-antitoxin module